MSAELVHIDHDMPERLRLRIPGRRGQRQFFHDLVGRLVTMADVQKVKANVQTGSVLIFRRADQKADWDERLLYVLSESGPTEMVSHNDGSEPALIEDVKMAVSMLDAKLRRACAGQLDLKAASGLTFVALGLLQMVRGKTLPAGITMLNQGVFILTK